MKRLSIVVVVGCFYFLDATSHVGYKIPFSRKVKIARFFFGKCELPFRRAIAPDIDFSDREYREYLDLLRSVNPEAAALLERCREKIGSPCLKNCGNNPAAIFFTLKDGVFYPIVLIQPVLCWPYMKDVYFQDVARALPLAHMHRALDEQLGVRELRGDHVGTVFQNLSDI